MYNSITGIILSGGTSSRMGKNKALLPLGNKLVIEHIVDLMSSVFSELLLITNTPEEYKFLKLPTLKDVFKIGGPLAGIHSGLVNSKTKENFILSCDMPLMKPEIIKSIIEFETSKPITVCSSEGYLQHLAGRYSKSVLQTAEKLLENEAKNIGNKKHRAKVYSLLNDVGFETIKAEELPGYEPAVFFNMNNQDDYEKMLSLF